MPKSNHPGTYRAQYVPSFQTNSDGIVANNSAQTQMHVGLQNLLIEQGSRPKKALESEHMRRRQGIVDRYNEASGGPDKIKTEKFVLKLPAVASPQPVFSGLYDKKSVAAGRAKQANDFAGSFLAKGDVYWKMVYNEIDDAMKESEERKNSLSFAQNKLWSPEKKSTFIYEPLREAVRWLDDNFKKDDDPLRIKWREVKIEPGKTRVDLYFVFPNLSSQYENGFRKWMGAEDVTTP